ncbi:hypothetical protein [Microbacterium flavum]|uniref:hypothetical protein n=1 Tax=Microbacterium flavum TaxID=415216 RepID=UPI0024ADBF32|nr:hypothetical protein [Microbacterium flavum]
MPMDIPAARRMRRIRSFVAMLATASVVMVSAVFVSPAIAAPPVSSGGTPFTGVEVEATGSDILAAGVGTVSVTARNTTTGPLYNGTVVAVLPLGVTYVPGSSQPGPPNAPGEPQVRLQALDPDNPTELSQVLVWSNISDLPLGAELDLGFSVEADNALFPVGSTVTIDAGVYANSDPRLVPAVTIPTDGTPPVISRATAGGDDSVDLAITALRLSKSNLEAEQEVYRGEANTTRYSLTVTTAEQAGTDGVVVVDRVPGHFQVLDCELGDPAFSCDIAYVTVDGEDFTELTWNLGDLPADTSVTLTYSAFVGLQEITAPDGDADGAATRPGPTGTPVENTADASGTYGGSVAEGTTTAIGVSASTTVTILDVGIVKTTSAPEFFAGETTTFSLAIRSSEYITTSGIVVTDSLPDGLCPIVPAGVATSGSWPVECPAPGGAGDVTGGAMTEAVANADGTFTLTFAVDADALPEDGDATITYTAFMREQYQDGSLTTSGDVLTNTVDISGTTTPAAGNTVDTGDVASTNDSAASLGTPGLSMTKTIWTNPDREAITSAAGAGDTCFAAPADQYVGEDGPRLQLGDLACFRISIDFPAGVSTRDAILADFLPPGTEFVEWAAGPGNSASIERLDNDLQWLLGDENPNGSRYVEGGQDLVLDLLVRVVDVPGAGQDVDITGNLAKLRYTSGSGEIMAARDDVDLTLAPVAPLELAKRAAGQTTLVVQEEQVVPFTIDVTHAGTAADGNDYPLDSVTVWDVLPDGFGCADVSDESPAPSDCSVATTGPASGQTLIVWELEGAALGADEQLLPGETIEVSYSITVPSPLSINTAHTNQAAVTVYTAPTTDGTPESAGAVDFWPENPFDAFPDEIKNAPEASDIATITLPPATVDKDVVATGITAGGNSSLTQATIGETVDYAYSVTIPAHTSVFQGTLDDGLPLGARLVQAGDPTLSTAPGGITVATGCAADAVEFRLCADGTLLFPTAWTNDTDTDAVFTVTLPTRVADQAANINGGSIPNTATFRSALEADGTPVSQGTAVASIGVVEPSPTLAKTSSASTVSGGQDVEYTLTATNAAGRSPLYDGVVVDCVPGALQIGDLPAGLAGPVPGDGSNGCALGTQVLTWTLAAPLEAGSPQSVTYPVTIPASAPAGQRYTNEAELTGASVPGDEAEARTYTADASRDVDVVRPTLSKTASTATIVPGQAVTWTVTATIPANVELFNAAFVDALPVALSAVESWSVSCGGGDATWQADCVTATELTRSPATSFGVLLGTIAPAPQVRTLTLTLTTRLPVATTAVQGANQNNTAQLRWNFEEETAPTSTAATWDANAQATASTQVRHPEVTVAKSVSDTTPAQGETFVYTVRATTTAGARNVPAFNVVIRDTVPVDVIVLGADGQPIADGASTPSGGVWDAAARTLTWTVDTLAPGSANAVTRTYSARLDVSSTLAGSALTNTVRPQSWTSLATDGRTYGPGTAATASVTPQFPLITSTKTQVTPANPVYIGQEVTFRFELTNTGGATAVSLDAVDTLPSGWSYVTDSAQVTVRTGAAAAVEPTITGQVLRWNDIGGSSVSLQPLERIVVTYRAVADDSVDAGLSVAHTNTVVAADVTDATGGTSYNGGAGSYIGAAGSATARIALADLAITKVANDDFVAGETGTYTVTVTNNGPDPAIGVVVTDTAVPPAGVTVLGASGAGWTCGAPVGGGFSCARTTPAEPMPSGSSWTLTVRAAVASTVEHGVEIPNSASVSATTEDRTPGNNTDDDTAVVRASADLVITKTADTASATAGGPLGWTVTVTNNGPSVSRGSALAPITITDTLPADVEGITVVSTTGGADCAIAAGTLDCDIPVDLAVGATVTVVLAGMLAADVAPGSTIANTATVTPVTTDPETENNSSTSETPTVVEESLTVDKTIVAPVPPEALPGGTLTYRITVANGGPSDARGVFVVDDLPDGVTFDSIVAGGDVWTAVAQGEDVRFDLTGLLAAGADSSFDILVDIDSGVVGDVTNTAVVGSTWRADQDSSQVTTGSNAIADLAITKSVDVAEIVAGAATGATYTLEVVNLGPSDAAGPVTVSDLLPAGMTLVGSAPAGCVVADESGRQRVTCEKPDGLDVGETAWTITLPVVVDAAVTATSLVNTATVSSVTPDPVPGNNSDSASVAVVQRATLTLVKDAPASAVAGEDISWTVTVTNTGHSDAQAVSISDTLDSRLTLVSASSITEGVTCTGTTAVLCAVGTMEPGASVVVTLVTTVASTVPAGTVLPNAAVANSSTIDPVTDAPATATDDAEVTVDAVSVLQIDKSATTLTVEAGEVATYLIEVTNDGPSDAAAPVTIVDTLPVGQTFLAATNASGPPAWVCAAEDQTVTCVLENAGTATTLAAGASAPLLQIATTVSAGAAAGIQTNTAQVSSPSSEISPTDDAEIVVITRADLQLIKSHAPDADAVAGESFTWLLSVVNHGPSDSLATVDDPIVVRDVLPVGVTLAASPASGGPDTTCSVTGTEDGAQVVECVRTSTLAAGDTLDLTLEVDLDQAVEGDLVNTAQVTPGVTPQPADPVWPDSDSDTISVVEVADLAITKTVDTDPVVAGGEVSWTVEVENLGPSDSDASEEAPITVVDTLPVGIVNGSGSGDGWTCVALAPVGGAERLSCVRDETLPVGPAPALTITGTVSPSVEGEITNVVRVTPGLTQQPTDGPGPDEASSVVPITTSADLAITKTIAEEIVAGSSGVYRFQIINLGPSDAQQVAVSDPLPTGLTFAAIAGGTDGYDWSCTADGADPDVVSCNLDGPLPAGATITLDIRVDAEQQLQGDLENTVTVSSTTSDPDPLNNSSTVEGTLVETADLAIVKAAVGSPVVGSPFAYTLTVTNDGPSLARGVVVTDEIPAQLQVDEVTADGWTCAVLPAAGSPTAVTCTIDEIAAGATAAVITATVTVLPDAYPAISNTATVTSATPEDPSTLADNTSTVTTPVPARSELAITKEITGVLEAGFGGEYTITVTNLGPTPDPGPVLVTDVLASALTFERAELDGTAIECEVTGQVVVCDVGPLEVDQRATLVLNVRVGASATGEIENVASVSSQGSITEPTASATGEVDRSLLAITGGAPLVLLPLAFGAFGAIVLGALLLISRRRRFETPPGRG